MMEDALKFIHDSFFQILESITSRKTLSVPLQFREKRVTNFPKKMPEAEVWFRLEKFRFAKRDFFGIKNFDKSETNSMRSKKVEAEPEFQGNFTK